MTEEIKEPVESPKVIETKAEEVIDAKVEAKILEDAAKEAQKEMVDLFKDNSLMNLAEMAVQNNEIVFEDEGITYRVRKATFQEKQAGNNHRMKKYIELLKDKDCLLEKDLKKLYKDRGIDLDDMDKQLTVLSTQQKSLMFDLGDSIKAKKPKTELMKYKEEIITVTKAIQELNVEKQQLLEFTLENRVIMEVYSYLIWTTSEKKVGNEWVKIWNTHDEFLGATPNNLLGLVTKNGAILITDEMNLQTSIL